MREARTGKWVKVGKGKAAYKAYIPTALPLEPPLDMSHMQDLISQTHLAIGRLDSLIKILPNYRLFLAMYSYKEALLSSQIEGTQSSFSTPLEAKNVGGMIDANDDATVLKHNQAVRHGLKRMKKIPLSLRLIRDIHSALMEGQTKDTPGEFRRSQNWIKGSSPSDAEFVPPANVELMEHLENFENFLHLKQRNSIALVDAAIAHAQFETIHPFLDGNGRVGRILITLMLMDRKILESPILHLSLYFKRNRSEYYRHLNLTRQTGDWEAWVKFFLKGVLETSTEALELVKIIKKLFDKDQAIIEKEFNRINVANTYKHMQEFGITNTKLVMAECKVSKPTALKLLRKLADVGIIKEVSGRYSRKIFVYSEYIKAMSKDTAPLEN